MGQLVQNKIILVNDQDQIIGSAEKQEVHQRGLLHRAFSIFIFRYSGKNQEVLLQKRHRDKYHSGGLWTNTCCGHPYCLEDTKDAAERRLKEEMGFTVPLKEIKVFHYYFQWDRKLIENEIDHVFLGYLKDEAIRPNPIEVEAIAWVGVSFLKKDLLRHPENYTVWLEKALGCIETDIV